MEIYLNRYEKLLKVDALTMKVLLTGATGFVGHAMVAKLLADDVNVLAAVRNRSTNLPEPVQQVVLGDLSELKEEQLTYQVLREVHSVIHSAARVHVMQDNSSDSLLEFRKVNRDGTLILARMAAKAGVKRFVFISSIGVHGNNNLTPFSELHTPEPHDLYAISKLEAEQELLALTKKMDMEVVIIRPPLVYGNNAPGNFGRLVKWINKGIPLPFGIIHNKRSLIALDNLVDFIALCADRKRSLKAANQVFLISDNEDVSTTQLLQKVAKAQGKRAWLIPVPVSWMTFVAKLVGKEDMANRLFGSLQVDSRKARDLLGWKPVITMDEQLQKIVKTKH